MRWKSRRRRNKGTSEEFIASEPDLAVVCEFFSSSRTPRLGVLGCIEDLYLHNCNSPRMRQFQGDFFVSLEEKCMQIYLFHFHVHARRRCNIVQTAQHDITFLLVDRRVLRLFFGFCAARFISSLQDEIFAEKMYVYKSAEIN